MRTLCCRGRRHATSHKANSDESLAHRRAEGQAAYSALHLVSRRDESTCRSPESIKETTLPDDRRKSLWHIALWFLAMDRGEHVAEGCQRMQIRQRPIDQRRLADNALARDRPEEARIGAIA